MKTNKTWRIVMCIALAVICCLVFTACEIDLGNDDGGLDGVWSDNIEIVEGEIIADFSDGKSVSFGKLEEKIFLYESLSDGSYAVKLDASMLTGEYAIEQDGVNYVLNGNQLSQLITEIHFPETHQGQPVTMIQREYNPIGSYVTASCFQSVTAVTIPETVTVIGEYAFFGFVALKNITLHEGITALERNAFAMCEALESVTLPASLKDLCEGAFSDCISLTKFVIPDTVEYIGEYVISGCTSLKHIVMPLPNPNTLTNGAYRWFASFASGCPDGLTVEITKGDVLYGSMFAECSNLSKVIIHQMNEVESIAFYECYNLEEVEFGAEVKLLQDSVLSGCPKLRKVTFCGVITGAGRSLSSADSYAEGFTIHFDGSMYELPESIQYDWYGFTVVCNDGTVTID